MKCCYENLLIAAMVSPALLIIISLAVPEVSCFWDVGTTTKRGPREDDTPRQSFFRWQWVYSSNVAFWFYYWDWPEIENRRRLNTIAGISIDQTPLSTATMLNRRILLTSYNFLAPYMNRQKELRIWALGRAGSHITPYRYRVWSVTRLIPWSLNTEHCHGPRCLHQPRHDVSIIISWDQIYLYPYPPVRYHYPYRAFIPPTKRHILSWDLWMAGSGYEYLEHIQENYKIFYHRLDIDNIVDCSRYLPKYWGKFICIRNTIPLPGVQNGGPLMDGSYIVGLGCFEIRYNEDKIFVFTDIRYYMTKINYYAYIWPGQYYEYAYAQWSAGLGFMYDSMSNVPYIPGKNMMYDLYPLGK